MRKEAVVQGVRYALVVLIVLAVATIGALEGIRYLPHTHPLPTEVRRIPIYAMWSLSRMLLAYVAALLFSIPYGYFAATNKRAERILMPLLDVLQSVPVLGFLPPAIYFFISLTHGGERLGVELASIFLIFTSQAWNIAFGVYEAITTIPQEQHDALASQGVTSWLKFRRLYLPACVPKLVYNSILSWAAGWYFLIACEIITVGPSSVALPGLGSFLKRASAEGRVGLEITGVGTLIFIVVAMHLFIWQPLESWSEKFRYEFAASTVSPSRMLRMWRDLGVVPRLQRLASWVGSVVGGAARRVWPRRPPVLPGEATLGARIFGRTLYVLAGAAAIYVLGRAALGVAVLLRPPWPAAARSIPGALGASFLRLAIAYAITLAWTIPVAVWAGGRPRVLRIVGPFAQVASSVPATVFFPIIVAVFVSYRGGTNIASVLLVLTGMQWYLLFNLLAGVHGIPGDLREATRSLGLSRWQTFRTLVLPAMLPSLVTGSITGWGGGWNALILSEYVEFAGHTYQVLGIGALLQSATQTGDKAMMILTLTAMVLVIVVLNRFFWRRLYLMAADRFKIEY